MKKHRAIIACVLALCLMLGAAAPASAHHGDCPVHHAAASTASSTTHHSGHHGGHH